MDAKRQFMNELVMAQGDLGAFIASLIPFHSDAVTDILQETNLRLISEQDRYNPDLPFMPWAITYAKHQVLGYLRDLSRERVLFSSETIDRISDICAGTHGTGSGVSDAKLGLLERLRVCRAKLKERERLLLQLFYDEETPIKVIAGRLGRKEPSVRVTLSNIRRKLGSCVRLLCKMPDADFERVRNRSIDKAIDLAAEGEKPSPRLLREAEEECRGMDDAELLDIVDELQMDALLKGVPATSARKSADHRAAVWRLAAGIAVLLIGLAAFGFRLFQSGGRVSGAESPGVSSVQAPAVSVSGSASAVPSASVAEVGGGSSAVSVSSGGTTAAVPVSAREGGEKMNSIQTTLAAVATVAATVAAPVVSRAEAVQVGSNMIRLNASYEESLQWRTALSASPEVSWAWPAGARSAMLTVLGNGVEGHIVTNRVSDRATASCLWPAGRPSASSPENVCTLTLTFYESEDALGEPMGGATLTAPGIGVVGGVCGTSTRLYPSGSADAGWGKVRGSTVVLPVPSGTVGLSVNGRAQSLAGVPGWCLLSGIADKRAYSLLLSTESGDYPASFVGEGQGTVFYFLP